MIKINKFMVPNGYRAITLYPFIFVRNGSDKYDKVLINHERIHLRQQLELLVIIFYIWYILDYFIKLCKLGSRSKAYRNIIFEREAYDNQDNLDYLKSRKCYQYLRK